VGEAAGLGQLVGRTDSGDHVHAAARADRGELPVVAGEQQFDAAVAGDGVDGGEIGGVGHRGLVDDDQVARAELPVEVITERRALGESVLGVQPAGDVARVQAFAGEHVGGDLAGREPDHLVVLAVPHGRVLPGLSDRSDDE
jgi:hypothetical protein